MRWTAGILVTVLAAGGTIPGALAASAEIARRTVTVPVRDLVLPVPVSGELTYMTREGTAVVDGRLEAELTAAQKHSTELLRALINRHAPCGERISVREGRIGARSPALRVTGTAEYERTICVASNSTTIVPRSPIRIDLLLHPIVQPRSLRVRAQVVDVTASGRTIPALAKPLKETLGTLISERIGELFPAGAVPADTALKSISFDEVGRGALIARVTFSGSLPQPMLDRILSR
jgi:hypothetical protein